MSSPEQDLAVGWRRHLPVHAQAVLAGQEGLEPPTAGFGDRNSSQLSYCPVTARAGMHGPLVDTTRCSSVRGLGPAVELRRCADAAQTAAAQGPTSWPRRQPGAGQGAHFPPE